MGGGSTPMLAAARSRKAINEWTSRRSPARAVFSLLAPHTRIPPHTGVANTRLVCHLPLIVPPDCGFRVGETTCEWRVGEAFVFDDTIEHEAWNESDELRVVLIIDLWPPALVRTAGRLQVIGASGATFMGRQNITASTVDPATVLEQLCGLSPDACGRSKVDAL
jgi:aspartyl/asparaginyl beta-hydroxylase (cupin superfamily)